MKILYRLSIIHIFCQWMIVSIMGCLKAFFHKSDFAIEICENWTLYLNLENTSTTFAVTIVFWAIVLGGYSLIKEATRGHI